MIEKLNNFKVNLVSQKKNRKFNKRTIYAVELLKDEGIYYNIDKKIKLGKIEYKYQDELLKIMLQVLNGVVTHLELDTERVIFNDSQAINIEVEKEIKDLGEDETILIFGFYEINADRSMLITFEDQIVDDKRYLLYKNFDKVLKFPYSAYIDKDLIN
ncbi:hypothetical protein SAMN04488598_13814 [Halanaerobium congolense]|uniref:Uncharacterized protein n=1 Tax=Halanaerobium congolense TaxID=54121 RepID=A0A1I0CKX3_9FIRM|nr:hypothetical protein [Halanaerobium congolense]PTX14865.1 hypothetical protein C7953_2931 [Halanaerobium congolense]SDG01793.1 hypothetical protein SAMN04488598_13814 [Halanaerobium congolense]SET19832.1 hypothetical protein SAMN04515652_13814 [Halanaerobium congolense]SFP67017.1 hypothetical protein SAMN04488596_13812 [Halanaerobium congolense]